MADSANSKQLHLDQQLCFPLYAASRLITRHYQPLLEPLGLTYPQYIVLMILWEASPGTITHIGNRAQLASNTLTPLLKRLAGLGLVERKRNTEDEREVLIHLTPQGRALKAKCKRIPQQLFEKIGYPLEDALNLKMQLDQLLLHLQRAQPV